jgi:hypothetical protein
MIRWFSEQGWRLVQYPLQVLFNGMLLWLVLNRLAPPRMVIENQGDARAHKPVLRKIRQFPFFKCQACSLLLFVIALFAAAPVFYLQRSYGQFFILPGMAFFILIWFFGSRWAVSTVFEGSRGHHYAIFIFYIAISLGVDWVVGLLT